MRVCIICEGSYPYVHGGVSSWIHVLIREIPEIQFVIYSIGAEKKLRGQFKYTLPENVIKIQEFFLDSFLKEQGKWGKRYQVSEKNREALKRLITGDEGLRWEDLFTLLMSKKFKSVSDFLMSNDLFDILAEVALQKYDYLPFTDLYWSIRSMLLPLFQIVRYPVPEADLYHSVTTGYAGIIGSLATTIYHKPFILTEHGIYSREREEEIIKSDWVTGDYKDVWIKHYYTLSRCAYEHADQVITLYNGNREIELELGCPEEKIRIIPNGINSDRFQNLTKKGYDDPEIMIGAIVRVVPIKDIKTMIQSFKLVQNEFPNAHFYIMGSYDEDLEYYEECLQLVEALQIYNLIFTGQVDLREYLGKLDLLVLTSISEGQPLAVLEGMAAGVPVVATDVGSCKELIYGLEDSIGSAGIVTPVMNDEEIAKAIIHLIKDPKKRKNFGENGKLRVSRFYREQDLISEYKRLYQSFLESEKRAYEVSRSWPV